MKDILVIYGGTFDPIHLGHITPSLQACTTITASKLLFLPCYIPPHKEAPSVTSEHRLNMVNLVANKLNETSSFPICVSDYEIQQQGQSYTRLSIEHFAKLYPNKKLMFLIGMDSYLNFTSWHKWQEILDYCQLLVVKRPGYQLNESQIPELILNNRQIVEADEVNVSSTQIRQASDLSKISHLLTSEILGYIKQHELYDLSCTQ